MIYYVHPKVLCSYVRGNLVATGCSKAIFGLLAGHGKSPCFLRLSVLKAVGVDAGRLVFTVVNGVVSLEWTCCAGIWF